jgi:glucoamylase
VHATLDRLEVLFARLFSVNTSVSPKGPLLGRFEGDGYYGGGAFLITTLAAAQVSYAAALRIAHGADVPCDGDNMPFLRRILGPTASLAEGSLLPTLPAGRRSLAMGFFSHGDQILGGLQRLMPQGARLPEQLDRITGAPRSVQDLGWSHAAFITAAAARARVRDALKEHP